MVEKSIKNVILIRGETEFQKQVQGNKAVVAFFGTAMNRPVEKYKKIFYGLAEKNPGLILLDIDIKNNYELSQKLDIGHQQPVFILFADGKKLAEGTALRYKTFVECLPKAMPTIDLKEFRISDGLK